MHTNARQQIHVCDWPLEPLADSDYKPRAYLASHNYQVQHTVWPNLLIRGLLLPWLQSVATPHPTATAILSFCTFPLWRCGFSGVFGSMHRYISRHRIFPSQQDQSGKCVFSLMALQCPSAKLAFYLHYLSGTWGKTLLVCLNICRKLREHW